MSIVAWRWGAALLLVANLGWYWYANYLQRPPPEPPGPLPGVQRLVLLSETSAEVSEPAAVAVAESSALLPTQEGAPAPSTRCWNVGPLDAQALQTLREQFQRQGMPMRRFQRERRLPTDYQVYVVTRDATDRAAMYERLDALNLRNREIREGELAGNIELGIFAEREEAEAMTAPLLAQGIPVIVHTRSPFALSDWLLVDSGEAALLSWGGDLSALQTPPGATVEPVPCDGVH